MYGKQLSRAVVERNPLQSLPEAMKKARPRMRVHTSRNFMVKLVCCTDGLLASDALELHRLPIYTESGLIKTAPNIQKHLSLHNLRATR